MDKATRLVLAVIGRHTGMTASQVEEEATAGTLPARVKACCDCSLKICKRCQVAYSIKNRTH